MSYSQASLGNAACYIILFENQNICYQINDLENQLYLSLSLTHTHTHILLLTCVQLFCDPMYCSLPDSSVHGISQARILEWVAISFSRSS